MMAKKKGATRGTRSNGTVRVKGHTRTPRGANTGKKPVYVKGYTRKKAGKKL
jgi:hypothetical protein